MTLVTAIMPTRGREALAALAVENFIRQTYPRKELIILDDSDDPSFPDGPTTGRYNSMSERLNIAQKRNLLCAAASGDIIMHWDSDDWSAPERMADQVARLEESGKAVTGYHSILFHEPSTDMWGKWVLDPFAAFGTSLCFRKSWWERRRFDEAKTIGEDNAFVYQANTEGEIVSVDGCSMIVARAHQGNTSPKDMANCRPVDPSRIPVSFK